jgi:hypothetical protein
LHSIMPLPSRQHCCPLSQIALILISIRLTFQVRLVTMIALAGFPQVCSGGLHGRHLKDKRDFFPA